MKSAFIGGGFWEVTAALLLRNSNVRGVGLG